MSNRTRFTKFSSRKDLPVPKPKSAPLNHIAGVRDLIDLTETKDKGHAFSAIIENEEKKPSVPPAPAGPKYPPATRRKQPEPKKLVDLFADPHALGASRLSSFRDLLDSLVDLRYLANGKMGLGLIYLVTFYSSILYSDFP